MQCKSMCDLYMYWLIYATLKKEMRYCTLEVMLNLMKYSIMASLSLQSNGHHITTRLIPRLHW